MASKKKPLKKIVKKPAPKRPAPKKAAAKKATATKSLANGLIPRKGAKVIYVDSCFFFPGASSSGYVENFQEGRNTVTPGHGLMAALPLPVGSTIRTIYMEIGRASCRERV